MGKLIIRFEDLLKISNNRLKALAEFINYNGRIKEWVNPLEELKSLEPKFFNQQQTRFIPDDNWSKGTEYLFHHIHKPLMMELGYYDDNFAAESALFNSEEAKKIIDKLIDIGRHLVTSKNELSKVCKDRNSVIHNLSNACQDRLELINRLTDEAEERGKIIHDLENKIKIECK